MDIREQLKIEARGIKLAGMRIPELRGEIAKLEAANKQLKKNADRYLFLRSDCPDNGLGVWALKDGQPTPGKRLEGGDLDAAIDAATA